MFYLAVCRSSVLVWSVCCVLSVVAAPAAPCLLCAILALLLVFWSVLACCCCCLCLLSLGLSLAVARAVCACCVCCCCVAGCASCGIVGTPDAVRLSVFASFFSLLCACVLSLFLGGVGLFGYTLAGCSWRYTSPSLSRQNIYLIYSAWLSCWRSVSVMLSLGCCAGGWSVCLRVCVCPVGGLFVLWFILC